MEDNTMDITSATLSILENEEPKSIMAVIDGKEMSVPMDPRNRHYKEILRQTEANTLTIEESSND